MYCMETLRNLSGRGWGGYHQESPYTYSTGPKGDFAYCPVQKDNISKEADTVELHFVIKECGKSDIDEGRALLGSMIDTLIAAYKKIAKVRHKIEVKDIKAIYAGNNNAKFIVTVRTPIMKDGRYLIDDVLGRYTGYVPESHTGNRTVVYRIKKAA